MITRSAGCLEWQPAAPNKETQTLPSLGTLPTRLPSPLWQTQGLCVLGVIRCQLPAAAFRLGTNPWGGGPGTEDA